MKVKKISISENYNFYLNEDDDIVMELFNPDILIEVFGLNIFDDGINDIIEFHGINQLGEDVLLRLVDFSDTVYYKALKYGEVIIKLFSKDGSETYFNETLIVR